LPDWPPTEERNGRTLDLDTLPTRDLLDRLNDEDALVAPAVRRALPALATVVDEAARRIGAGGTVGRGKLNQLAVAVGCVQAHALSHSPASLLRRGCSDLSSCLAPQCVATRTSCPASTDAESLAGGSALNHGSVCA